MKLSHGANNAFTLPEVLVATTVLSMIIAGIVTSHIFGLKMSLVSGIKLNACEDGRKAAGLLLQDIRGALTIDIGNVTFNTFTPVADGTNQVGNAIQIYTTTNKADYVRYDCSTSNTLCRIEDGQANATVAANYITNKITVFENGQSNTIPVFSEVDFNGNSLTNRVDSAPIRVFLRFINPNPQVIAGPANTVVF